LPGPMSPISSINRREVLKNALLWTASAWAIDTRALAPQDIGARERAATSRHGACTDHLGETGASIKRLWIEEAIERVQADSVPGTIDGSCLASSQSI
jgi:hypothetical protein